MHSFKRIATWTGIALTCACGIVLLGGGKIVSGTLLVITAFTMALLVGRNKIPVWARVVLLCAVFGLVTWNISTTELPAPSDGMVIACPGQTVEFHESTGFKFLDQLILISGSFIDQAEFS